MSNPATQLVVAIVGPTASGKTAFALQLAARFRAEIVCMDSATVYKGFDIGTGKPTPEERAKTPHHLLDVFDPCEPFSAFHFVQRASEVISDIHSRGNLPLIVGGTYFYLRALQHGMYPQGLVAAEVLEQLEKEFAEDDTLNGTKMHAELKAKDPAAAEAIHPNDKYRVLRALAILRTTKELPSSLKPVPPEGSEKRIWMKYALISSRHQLNQAIVRRTESMLTAGLVAETKALMERDPKARALASIGYAEGVRFLNRQITEKQLRNEIIEKTRQLAKRQMTWLKSDHEIRFIDFNDLDRVQLEVENIGYALKTPTLKLEAAS